MFKEVTLVRAGKALSAKRSHKNYERWAPREANRPGGFAFIHHPAVVA